MKLNYLQTLSYVENLEKQLANDKYWLEKTHSEKVKKYLQLNIELKERFLKEEKEKLPTLKEEYKKEEIDRLLKEIERVKAL